MNKLGSPFDGLVTASRSPTRLDADDRFPLAWHRWSDAEVRAIVQAWASGRPLLVRGEAGCGKSQLARAVAKVLGVSLEVQVIHPRFEATDLLYRFDPVRRLAQAQLLAALRAPDGCDSAHWRKEVDEQLDPSRYVSKGPIWRAMTSLPPTNQPTDYPRCVLLIDEIDKADADVPNALLDVLGNRSFTVDPTGQVIRHDAGHAPLILVTTNEDRELPAAFVRRCAALNLRPEDSSETAFCAWLQARARAHEALDALTDDHLKLAACQVWADRKAAESVGLPTVGLAEYLDLLYALQRLSGGDPERVNDLLDQLSPYALVKHRDQVQGRQPVSRP